MLGKGFSLWGHIYYVGLSALGHRLVAVINRLALHKHSLPLAVRRIIHPAVLIKRIITDIVAFHAEYTFFSCSAHHALRQIILKHFGKKRCYVNIHTIPLSPLRPQKALQAAL